jgi:energy-coupling factor transport system ATP-binding protein
MDEILRIDGLSFKYLSGAEDALRDINLSVEKGAVIGITGPAGAGKSTLLSCVNGVIPHYLHGDLRGRVLLKGQEVKNLTFGQLAHVVGTVFQDVDFQTVSITVEEEVAFGPENLGIDPQEIEGRMVRALESTDVTHLRNRAINTLSGGQKQRVAVSAVLSMLPELLLLDEPTSELDPIGTMEVFDALTRLNREYGMTILVVSQQVEQLVGCHRIVVMSHGEIALEGNPKDVFSQRNKLGDIGIRVPEVMDFMAVLFEKLARPIPKDALPLTLDEAEALLRNILVEHRTIDGKYH